MSHNNNNNNNNNASEDLSKSVISDLYRAMGEKAAGEYIKDIKATKSKEEERKVDSLFVSFERKLSKDLIRKVLADQKGDENAALPILVEHMSQKPKPTNNNNNNNSKEDEKMKFIAILQSKFPLFETSRIQQVVEECKWNLNESAIKLSVIQTEMQINSLQEMFSSFSKGEVADVLKDCNNNFESAVKQFTRLQEMKESAEKEISKKTAEKERQAAEKERQLREKEQRLVQEKQAEEARRQNDEAKRQEERKRTDEQRRRLIEEQERILDEQKQKEEMRRFEERRRLEEHLRLEEEKELRRVQVEQEQASKAAMIEKLQQSAEFERKKLEEDQKLFAAEKKRLQDEQEKLDREKTQQLFQRLDIAEQHLQDPSTRSTTPDSSSSTTSTTISTIPVSSPPAEHPPQPGDESLKVRMKVSPLVVDVGQQIYVEWEIEAGTSTAYDWIGMYVSDPPQQNKSYVTYQYRGISEKKGLMTFIASANGKYEFRYVRNYQHFHKTEVVCVGPVFDVTAVLTHKEQQPTSATPILSQIVVNWNQRSGNQYSSSWVGLYNKTEKNVKNYITWNRTGKETQLSFPAPTQAGEYEIRFFSQSYEQVAISNPIIISEPTKTC